MSTGSLETVCYTDFVVAKVRKYRGLASPHPHLSSSSSHKTVSLSLNMDRPNFKKQPSYPYTQKSPLGLMTPLELYDADNACPTAYDDEEPNIRSRSRSLSSGSYVVVGRDGKISHKSEFVNEPDERSEGQLDSTTTSSWEMINPADEVKALKYCSNASGYAAPTESSTRNWLHSTTCSIPIKLPCASPGIPVVPPQETLNEGNSSSCSSSLSLSVSISRPLDERLKPLDRELRDAGFKGLGDVTLPSAYLLNRFGQQGKERKTGRSTNARPHRLSEDRETMGNDGKSG